MNDIGGNRFEASRKNRLGLSLKHVVSILLIILLLIGIGIGYQRYRYLEVENARLSNPQQAAQAESQRLKDEVGKLIEVPQDEQPTVATVVDSTKLQDQEFFRNAQNGDKVLIFAEAKKAILYRPSTKKVIEVAPVNLGANQKDAPPAGTRR